MTLTIQLVLRALLADPGREMYGLEIMRGAGLPSGTLYPILSRLEAAGWLEKRTEDIDPRKAERPRRHYYKLTGKGVTEAREAMVRAAVQLAALGAAFDPAGPLSIGGTEIPLIVDDRQPPGIVSVVSAGLDRDGKAVVHAAHVNIGPDEAESVSEGLCEHRRPPGSFCVRCGRLIGG
jgi:DNA-binding PadR family transcriptional regulator